MSNKNPNHIKKNRRPPRKNNRESNLLNKTFILSEKREIIENRRKFPSLDEAASRILRIQLDRSSSPNIVNVCDHCRHNHAQKCCMYVYDDWSDISRYSSFKSEVDDPYWVMNTSEDFDLSIGNTTPKFFPCKNYENSKFFYF